MRSLLAFLVAVIAAVSVPASALAARIRPLRRIDRRAPARRAVALKDDPRALRYIVDNLPPGTTVTRHVMMSNDTGAPAQIDVYAGAARVADGTFALGEGRDETHSRHGSPSTAHGRPRRRRTGEVAVTIAVPQDAPEVEQYAVIWASHKAPASNGITNESRVGCGSTCRWGAGTVARRLHDLQPDATSHGRRARVRRRSVTNTGGRAVDLAGT